MPPRSPISPFRDSATCGWGSNYVVIGPFDVPSGQEVQRNYYQKLPIDQDIYVTKIELTYNVGSHHLNIFKSDD